ncbi:hypothetical protein BKA70DRAFT_862847 [Coprinopsis sp. MPI-PUGE-AT-0042]|nr:hypothetical protein BKA70DRAFT_862847 [Coprinopsis sp. MPI-PUGE-AT-0042]
MATAAALSFEFQSFGRTVSVPDDDVARLMYYLNCVTASLGMDILQDDLLDYMNYRKLTGTRIAVVFKTAAELSPDIFIDKVLFRDDQGDVVPSGSSNKFVEITAACDLIHVQRDFLIGGQVKDVTKVMFFRSSWLKTYYSDPLERIANIILGSKHCSHCEGSAGICACSTCPRGSTAECRPIFESFLDVLLTGTTTTSSVRPVSPAPPPRPTVVQHQANCDGCQWQLFSGPRYKCNNCYDFDLCDSCYRLDRHIETGHHFRKYETPDSSPVYLAARTPVRAPPPPPPPYQEATRAPPMPTPIIPTRAPAPPPRSPPAPPAPPRFVAPLPSDLDRKTPLSSSSNANPAASKFFYQSMSIAELKAFLNERDVDGGDILDKETLCKRVWETHCDCMSISELNTFLSSSNIPTTGCRSVSDRRDKAKAAFEPPARPTPGPRMDRGSGGWRKDDVVVLTGLSKADMNGKVGKIQVIDSEARKVTVFVDDFGRAFKVKYENVQPYVEDLGGDDVEELE